MQAKSEAENRADYCTGYSEDVDVIREREYPFLKDATYLDHAGTTLYPKSLIDSFARDLTSNLFGNPHSQSSSSQLSTQRVDDIRLKALRFFNADPDEFDLVFVANATAAIKLVAEVLRDSSPQGFWYGYFIDAHTSLVGVRGLAERGHRCFVTGGEVEQWIAESAPDQTTFPRLFAYPGQSNLNGRRSPLQWCKKIREGSSSTGNVYTLLDAASLVSSSPLDLSDASAAPDFTALSFYKIFGFPDLGALIVRKSAAGMIEKRKFFGGGTVDMVLAQGAWHAKKSTIHESLEDGTLPFHNIIALDSAFSTHKRLFGSMSNVSTHTRYLARRLHDQLAAMTHFNGEKVCHLYTSPESNFDNFTQGPIIAFNIRNSSGAWVGKSEVERLANVKKIQIRSGSLCNPGGASSSLGWTGPDLLRNFSAGLRCGDDHDIMDGKPTGILRVSLGAVTNLRDIDTFTRFVDEFYVERPPELLSLAPPMEVLQEPSFYVESLSVYPIKSCGAFKVPEGQRWEIKKEGLAWDREWCLIHQGTGAALSMKKYPRMTMIRPVIDLECGVLRITCGSDPNELEISLRREITNLITTSLCQSTKSSNVCGDRVIVQAYASPTVATFFSNFLGVPCTLARFPPQISTRTSSKPIRSFRRIQRALMPGSFPEDPSPTPERSPILLSNESPILLISRSSVNRLNENIKYSPRPSHGTPAKAVEADVFRANIVVAENLHHLANAERPYMEDTWGAFSVGPEELYFDVLGSCQRCQMVCVDPYAGDRREEPFSTLAKTRKINGKIVFGRHASLSKWELSQDAGNPKSCTVMVGDIVTPHIS
ncbi:molybdenum cofactor sulfurase protein [Aspergillus bertholletiae]|uniref:Molybdenum cofactor sulfurase n=1 Tax=Aspergillus bertholletiae TaxID=1226010 RepID=A0A5N7AVC4_9EURO|nr:molybdenum cofactor sulfurase protein [Aspergillus bertholletiae]